MVNWPWVHKSWRDKFECKYLIKHYATGGEISGVSIPQVSLGRVAIEPKLLLAASQALELIDASQYHFCEAVKNAPDDESRTKYYSLMMEDKRRAQDIILGLAALSMDPESEKVKEGIMDMLLKNHNRALQIEQDDIKVDTRPTEENIKDKIEIPNTSLNDKIRELQTLYPSYANKFNDTTSQGSYAGTDYVGLYHLLLANKISTSELRTICFEFKVEYDDIAGETRRDKARELILYLRNRDKLDDFYDFLINYLARRKSS